MAKRRENRRNEKTRERWAEEIRNWRASGKSQKKYCEERGVSFWNFKYWGGILKRNAVSALIPISSTCLTNQQTPKNNLRRIPMILSKSLGIAGIRKRKKTSRNCHGKSSSSL